jgi:hypothetical protein
VQEQFAEKFQATPVLLAAKSAVYNDRPCTLNELKTAITVYIRNISQADLYKVFANKKVHNDFPNTLYVTTHSPQNVKFQHML